MVDQISRLTSTGASAPAAVGSSPISTGSIPPLLTDAPPEASRPDDEPEVDSTFDLDILRMAPPWMVSLIIHMALLIVLALLVIPVQRRNQLRLQAVFAEKLGDQLDEEPFQLTKDPFEELEEQILSTDSLEPISEPFAAPLDLEPTFDPLRATSQLQAPTIGLALSGREKGFKEVLLGAYGGTETTERAVHNALVWLRRNQRTDGSWSLSGPYQDGSPTENQLAATAMALLAFQGAGSTHTGGEFKKQVASGWLWLRKQQDQDGNFWKRGAHNHRLYSQAQATIAICELFGMTKDAKFRQPAQRAVDYAVAIQGRQGGWRYQPGGGSDTSVTGWFVIALQSAMMAGLEVPSPALDAVSRFLDSVETSDGKYCYLPQRGPTVVMTAEALLCRQYLGWDRDNPKLLAGVQYLLKNPINWTDQNVYYWYYAAQVTHHMEGDAWREWNRVMRQVIPEHQQQDGKEAGSWAPDDDRWGTYGGRLYTTCMCVYMLEVYYRHLPIYSPLYRQTTN